MCFCGFAQAVEQRVEVCADFGRGFGSALFFFENTLEPFRPRCRAGYRYSSLTSFQFKPCSLRRQVSTGRRTLPVRKGMPSWIPRPAPCVCTLFSRRYGRKAVVCQKLILSLFCARLLRLPVQSALGAPAIAAIGPSSAYRSPARFAGRS